MSDWSPSPSTKKEIDWLIEDLFSVTPEVLGIDETITGCIVINLDPYGVGPGTLPRYILVSLRGGYHQDVFYRGGLPDMAPGDSLTVIHVREGNRYEVLGPGGATGVIPDPAPIDAEYVVMALDGTLTNERVLTGGEGTTLTDGGAGGLATLDWDSYNDQFVMMAASGNVPNERVLVARQWLDLTDGGAGGNVSLDFLPDNPARVQSTGVITEYGTIQAAINASAGGDWVAVPPGMYTEALTLKDGVPVTELFRHTVIIRQTTGTYTVQTTGTGTFLICVHRIEMDQALENNTGMFAVYANHTSGMFTVIADLYCRNSIITVNGCAIGLGNWNTGSVNHTGDIECLSTGYYFGCYAVRNDSTGTLIGRGDIVVDATDGFAYGIRNNSTGVLRWWGDLDVDTWGADPATRFAIGIRSRGGVTEWHGYMDVRADATGAKGYYASDGAGTAYLEGRIEVWGLDDSSYGIFMGAASACTTVVTFRGLIDVTNYNLHAYGSHTDPTYGDGTIWLHADVYVDGWEITRGISQEGSGITWHQDGGIDTINGLPIHDLYQSAGTLNISNSRYDRTKTFGVITEMDGDKVGHHKLASVAAGEGASLVGIQDAGAFYASVEVEGALQEIGGGGVVGTVPLTLAFSWMGF